MKINKKMIPFTDGRKARAEAKNYDYPVISYSSDIWTVWLYVFDSYEDRRNWVNEFGTELDVIPENDDLEEERNERDLDRHNWNCQYDEAG